MVISPSVPLCTIIAGPNGAGKTTFALDYLPEIAATTDFINADLIAAGLSPLNPEKGLVEASRLFLHEVTQRIETRTSFAFETTLSGKGHLRRVERLRTAGWRVELIYLALTDVSLSIERVAERVAHGGHSIPRPDIVRRFPRSLYNLLHHYAAQVDYCQCVLNVGESPELLFEQTGESRLVHNPALFHQLERLAAP